MSVAKKLFWFSLLLAAGYGTATLLGPPEPRQHGIHPANAFPLAGSSTGPAEQLASSPAMVGPLRLHADENNPGARDSQTPASKHGSSRQAANETPTWNSEPIQRKWAPTASHVKRTGHFGDDSPNGVEAAVIYRPTPHPQSQSGENLTLAHGTIRTGGYGLASGHGPSTWDVGSSPGFFDQSQPVYPTVERFGLLDDRAAHIGRRPLSPAGRPDAETSTAAAPMPPARDAEIEERSHVIVDGDSLPKLAERYLGDPRRDWEIFQLNRQLLRSHDLLPIGVVLTLPPRQARAPSAIEHPHRGSGGSPAGSDTSVEGLVPVPPLTTDGQPIPRAQLLRPVQIDAVPDRRFAPGETESFSGAVISYSGE